MKSPPTKRLFLYQLWSIVYRTLSSLSSFQTSLPTTVVWSVEEVLHPFLFLSLSIKVQFSIFDGMFPASCHECIVYASRDCYAFQGAVTA